MAPIVFGSPEAARVAEQDRKFFGTLGADGKPLVAHRWTITSIATVQMQRTYTVEAYSKEGALEKWRKAREMYDCEQEIDVVEEEERGIRDEGEVEA